MKKLFSKLKSWLNTIKSCLKTTLLNGKEHIKRCHCICYILTIIIVLFICCSYFYFYFDTQTRIKLDSIGAAIGGIGAAIIAIVGLYFFQKRLENQDKQLENQNEQIDLQIKQRVDERFNSAINLLGSKETSARTGAIYALVELAMDEPKYRKQIMKILCSHIRSKTNESDYKKEHDKRPSNEIQTTINLLFKKETGLYAQSFAKEANFPKADLSHAYLVGADFRYAECQGADFSNAECRKADFRYAECQGVRFLDAQCQGANFSYAECQKASFWNAQCQGARFWNTQCQGARFLDAQCQGANFWNTQCQGANFLGVQYQGACANDKYKFFRLKDRVGQDTELENLVFKGDISKETIQIIENSKPYLSDNRDQTIRTIIKENENKQPSYTEVKGDDYNNWYQEMQAIIEENKDKPPSYTVPDGCTTGILEDSEEIQAIISKLEQLKNHD